MCPVAKLITQAATVTVRAVKKYLAAIGRKGGKSASPAKQAAARANGRKGGRPPNKEPKP